MSNTVKAKLGVAGEVNSAFDQLRQALKPALKQLSAEQQASLATALDEQIDLTHQAILDQLRALLEDQAIETKTELTASAELFDEEAYRKKLQQLLAYGEEVVYTPVKDLPRDSEWRSTLSYFKHFAGNFFKMMLILGKNKTTGKEWLQGINIQEFDQYDKHACNKEIGRIILPIRFVNGQILAAISVKNPPGTLGQPLFTASRASHSNKNKPTFYEMSGKLQEETHRPDAARLTGKTACRVILLSEEMVNQIDQAKEKIVWFTIPELKHLMEEPQFEDSPTIALVRWLLLNAEQLQAKFQSSSG